MSESKRIITVKRPDIVDSYYEDDAFQAELDKLTDEQFMNAEQSRTIKNIRQTLSNTLKKKYGFTNGELKDLTTKLLKIHGLDASNFDAMHGFETIIAERLNDFSIDDNSNKNEKTVRGCLNEVKAPIDKLIGYDMLYRVMKELYGQSQAKILSGDMYDLSLGLSDTTSIMLPYCWALDASKIVVEGRRFGQLWSKPVKRVDSYIAALDETIHQLSSHLAGAIAIATYFLDICHILVYKQRVPLSRVKEDKDFRKYIENCMQTFIHSVNHLSRNGVESPFTNISIFDREKLKAMIGKDNYGWYLPNKEAVALDNGLSEKMSNEEFENFIVDYVSELQKIYVALHNAGDPSQNGMPYRFPVVTMNITKDDDGKVLDEDFLKYVCNLDVFRYNIFTSKGTKICSCCRLINDTELMDMGSQVNSFGAGGSASMGSHRVCTINFARIAMECSSLDEFYKILDKRISNAAKILKAHKVLIGKLERLGLEPFITRGWIRMDRLFSTFGVLGTVEARKILMEKYADELKDKDIMKDMLVFLNDKSAKYAKELGLVSNIEQIPAESFSVRLATADRYIFPDNTIETPMYANQFVPLWENATMWEKLDADGKYNALLNGGGIVHAQIGSKTTPTQNEKIIRYAISCGCEHFALNSVYTRCNKCGHVISHKTETCEKCGCDDVDYLTRVVGFFVPVSSWNKTRREWEFPKRKFVDDSLV